MQAELTSAGVQVCFACGGTKFVENLRVLFGVSRTQCCCAVLECFICLFFFGTRPPRNYTLCNESSCLPAWAHEWRERGRNEERAKQMTGATA